MKELIILGGPNGAGKTTAARVLLPGLLRECVFLNADEIARGIAPDHPETAALAAGRVLLARMKVLVRSGESFVFETTCAGRSYIPMLRACRGNGWRITLVYLWLPSPEDSIARVEHRVREGGHSIPSAVIYRRFRIGLWNMLHLYLPLADTAKIYDNSHTLRIPIAEREAGGVIRVIDQELWLRMEALSK